jgi:hypothetical protein
MTTTQKCENPGCTCQAEVGKKYCSTACADAKKSPEKTCHCKHPECSSGIGLKMQRGLTPDSTLSLESSCDVQPASE